MLGRRLLPPADAKGQGADQATGLAGPEGVRSGGADQTTGLAGPKGVSRGGTTPVGDLVDVAGQDGIGTTTEQGMVATLAPREPQGSFVFTGPPSKQHGLEFLYCSFNSTRVGDLVWAIGTSDGRTLNWPVGCRRC